VTSGITADDSGWFGHLADDVRRDLGRVVDEFARRPYQGLVQNVIHGLTEPDHREPDPNPFHGYHPPAGPQPPGPSPRPADYPPDWPWPPNLPAPGEPGSLENPLHGYWGPKPPWWDDPGNPDLWDGWVPPEASISLAGRHDSAPRLPDKENPTMTQPAYISPQRMRDIAGDHENIAEGIDDDRGRADEVVPAVLTWAPIQWRTKEAVLQAMDRHERSLREEAAGHRTLADQLRARANGFEQTDAANASRIEGVAE